MQKIAIGEDLVSLGSLIGKGGEGEVYKIKGCSGRAAKIYRAGLRAKREGKVRAMVGGGLAAATDLVAYPSEIVTDREGNFLGFAMRLVSGYHPIHELYNPKSRQRQFQKADYRFLVRAAQNVARAVGKVHQAGCVIGDLNHSGVLVAQNATVALIDADSFQFRLNDKIHLCGVGVPDFTPPELQGKNLECVERTIEHDNFGLAIAIFHLLFMGCHPYAGRLEPEIPLAEAIAQNRFAYTLARRSETRVSPPPGALTLGMFPESIIRSFEDAFGLMPGARPDAQVWIRSLRVLEHTLIRCGIFNTHYYPNTVPDCAWCRRAKKIGFDMFPSVPTAAPNIWTDTRDMERAIREIEAFRFPSAVDLLPSTATSLGPSSKLCEAKGSKGKRRLLSGPIVAGAAVAGIAGAVVAGPIGIAVAVAGVVLGRRGWIASSNSEIKPGPFLQAYKDADKQVHIELNAFASKNNLSDIRIEVLELANELNSTITDYRNHDRKLSSELRDLESTREARQRQAYLDEILIRRADIPGIGTVKTISLILYGIESAADVDRAKVLKVPGFDDDLTAELLAWRRKHEANFKYDPKPNAQDVADEQALKSRFATERAMLESSIRNGLGKVRNVRARLDALRERARSDAALKRVLNARARAKRDLEKLGVPVPPSSVRLTFQPAK